MSARGFLPFYPGSGKAKVARLNPSCFGRTYKSYPDLADPSGFLLENLRFES